MKTNCWQVKKCGREAGGPKEKELGVCVAATNFWSCPEVCGNCLT